MSVQPGGIYARDLSSLSLYHSHQFILTLLWIVLVIGLEWEGMVTVPT